MANKALGTFSELPAWARGTIAIIGVATTIGIGFLVYRKIKNTFGNKSQKDEGKDAKNQLTDLSKNGINPTLNQADLSSSVNVLLKAAEGCDPFGTGATEIMNIIYKCKNAADWYALVSEFGVKTWSDCFGQETGSITTLLLAELDTPQLAEARRHLGQFNVTI